MISTSDGSGVAAMIRKKSTIGAVSGIAGGVVLGVGGRAAMRVIALAAGLSPGFSLGGTVEVAITGLIIGAPAALGFALLRRLFPRQTIMAGVLFGTALFAGLAVLPPPAARSAAASVGRIGLTLAVFAPLFIVYGIVVAWLAGRMESRWRASQSSGPDGG